MKNELDIMNKNGILIKPLKPKQLEGAMKNISDYNKSGLSSNKDTTK